MRRKMTIILCIMPNFNICNQMLKDKMYDINICKQVLMSKK